MNGFDFLDLVIGLIFIYLIYSIVCSAIWELLINCIHLRGKMLYNWLKFNFNKNGLYDLISNHALVKGMSRPKENSKASFKPDYISAKVFSEVLLDLIVHDKNSTGPFDINSLKISIQNTGLLNDELKRVFTQFISESQGNLQLVKDRIGKWFDETQERLIGLFKKKVQFWVFIISLILVSATNADTVRLADYLISNDEARKTIADQAVAFSKDTAILVKIKGINQADVDSVVKHDQNQIVQKLDSQISTIKDLSGQLKRTGIPLGWSKAELKEMKIDGNVNFGKILIKFCGLLLSIFAVSLGSPFWFDILSKLTNLRSSGKKPETVLEKESRIQTSPQVSLKITPQES